MSALVTVVLAGCGSNPVYVEMTFENRTDSSLCLYGSTDAAGTDACSEIKANGRTTWDTGCGYGDKARSNEVTVVLTVGEDGPTIYAKTATCDQWLDADATFVIRESGGDLAVSDNLAAEN